MKSIIKSIARTTADLIFPSHLYCIACGAIIDKNCEYELCDDCMASIQWANDKTCKKCGKVLENNVFREFCFDCISLERSFDRGFSCVQYGEEIAKIIHALKYGKKSYIARNIGGIMADRINCPGKEIDMSLYQFLVPVPIHDSRLLRRGFNQSTLIAKMLIDSANSSETALHSEIADDFLIRCGDTEKMSRLSATQRIQNLRGAFALSKALIDAPSKIQGKNILLIDDILTSGATANVCAELLKTAGAKRVDLFTFASGLDIQKQRN